MISFRSVALWSALVLPSLGTLVKYLSWPGALGYAAAVWLLLGHAHRVRRIRPQVAASLVAGTFAILVGAFLIGHPIVDSNVPGRGSDDDEAHDVAVAALLAGESPYAQQTYLGNQLHQLPGAYLLAAPFVLAGSSAMQNLFWLGAFAGVIARVSGSASTVLTVLWIILAGSPAIAAHVIAGTSYPANAISVLLGLYWLSERPSSTAAAVFWGLTLASRANFLLLLPLAFSRVRHSCGLRPAVRAVAIAAGVVIALTLPFVLVDPFGFPPIYGAGNRVFRFDDVIPYLGTVLMVAIAAVSIMAAPGPLSEGNLLRRCAVVLAFPAIALTVAASLQTGSVSLEYAPYGVFASWFVFLDTGLAAGRSVSAHAPGADIPARPVLSA